MSKHLILLLPAATVLPLLALLYMAVWGVPLTSSQAVAGLALFVLSIITSAVAAVAAGEL